MKFRKAPLSLAVQVVVLAGAWVHAAESFAQSGTAPAISEIRVTALGVDEGADQVVAPFDVLDRDQVLSRSGTLGDMLNGLSGVHADSFGGGASRPVIRGQTSPRTEILSDGSSILDASDVSPDHAVTVDTLLAQRVEVLRGPATLLYGSGAIGGVVNVLDDKIPSAMPEKGYEGLVALRGNTVADEKAGALALTGQLSSNLAMHFESSMRDADDYSAPDHNGRIKGTAAENRNASVGASWIGDNGYIGLAYSYRDDDYGIPGHSEEYVGCHPHGAELHCGDHDDEDDHDHDHGEHEHGFPSVDLESKRVDLRGEYLNPFAGINKVRFRASNTEYQHFEIEEGEISSAFKNDGYEIRIEIDHAPVFGWQGLVGVQHADSRFENAGANVFMPVTDSKSTGVFVVEHLELNEQWHFEVGARYERQQHRPIDDSRGRPEFSGSTFSYSGAMIWDLSNDTLLSLTYARAQRLPQAQELFSRGIHMASNTFECGLIPHPLTCGGELNNQPLQKETADNYELGLRKVDGAFTYNISVFRNNVSNYIYARTLDQFEDFRLIKYTQRDAEFTGFEVEIGYRFNEVLSAEVFMDQVKVDLDGADRLPRIPPRRAGMRMAAQVSEGTRTELEYYRSYKPGRLAAFETATPAYDMVNLSLSYTPAGSDWDFFVRGSNLLDEEIRNHTSFLAQVIPMPGRNISAGLKLNF